MGGSASVPSVSSSAVPEPNTNQPAQAAERSPAAPPTTRLAPSPTGALHLGNARTFLTNWALARQNGWRIILRIEDLDGPRVKPDSAGQIVATLAWLGLDWDVGPLMQSADLEPYRAALRTLAASGQAYACDLSRAQVEAAASAPQDGSHEVRFPAELRPADFVVNHPAPPLQTSDFERSWRFATPGGLVEFIDGFAGRVAVDPAATIGDFIIWTRRGTPAYQLAVVVDDARQAVTDIVRGDDLLDSAARQRLLYRALGLGPKPRLIHLPLVIGPDGRRLAKRHGDSRVDTYRAARVPAEAIIGLVARWSGLTPAGNDPMPMDAREFAARLRLDAVPRGPVTFTPEDDAWLRSRAR